MASKKNLSASCCRPPTTPDRQLHWPQVCPADWQPGGQTMKADPDASLTYFEAKGEHAEGEGGDADDFGTKLRSITSAEEFEQAINDGQPTVVDFYAPWCGKCRQIAPFIEQLQARPSSCDLAQACHATHGKLQCS